MRLLPGSPSGDYSCYTSVVTRKDDVVFAATANRLPDGTGAVMIYNMSNMIQPSIESLTVRVILKGMNKDFHWLTDTGFRINKIPHFSELSFKFQRKLI